MKKVRAHIQLLLLLLWACSSTAQTNSAITALWPSSDKPTLKLTFGKFRQSGVVNGQEIFVCDVTAQNVSDQGVTRSVFTVYLSDKNGVRIGRARLQFPEIPRRRTQKAQMQFSASGTPAGVTLLAGKAIPLKVMSRPPGANFKVDGEDAGVTPKMVDFTIGSHTLEFTKEGYAPGNTPLEVTSDELPGGSITVELGGLSRDTVELRDGTVVLGDVIFVSMVQVTVRVDGKDQTYDRNMVKKIMLVEREVIQQAPVVQPAAPQAHP